MLKSYYQKREKKRTQTANKVSNLFFPWTLAGMFIEPSVEKESGIRRGFTEEERLITEKLMKRTETIGINGSHLSVDRGQSLSLSLFELPPKGFIVVFVMNL